MKEYKSRKTYLAKQYDGTNAAWFQNFFSNEDKNGYDTGRWEDGGQYTATEEQTSTGNKLVIKWVYREKTEILEKNDWLVFYFNCPNETCELQVKNECEFEEEFVEIVQ
jgi:hypothetical protein